MATNYILKSKCIFNSIDDSPISGGIAVEGGKIAGVFSEEELAKYEKKDAEILDYGNKTLMAGLIDSHTHTGNFMELADPDYCVDVSGSRSFSEIMEKIIAFGENHQDALLYAINLNLFDLEESVEPGAKLIDQYVSDRPVIIMTWDCHTWYANSKAIEMAGIKADTPDPAGSMEKDENGELTGVFNDTASYPLQKLLIRPIEARKKSLAVFLRKMNSVGITTVGDVFPYGMTEPYTLYKAAEEDGALTARICFYPSLLDFTEENVAAFQKEYNSDMLRFSGLKAILDGVLTVHTAWMLEPYCNNPKTCGGPVIDKDQLEAKVMEACRLGINCRIHAIGDAAIRFALDCYEKAAREYGPISRRHTIEHIESEQAPIIRLWILTPC